MTEYDRADEAAQFIKKFSPLVPEVGIVLGSGLGDFADTITGAARIHYVEIPHFRKVSVQGHAGQLVLGKCGGRPVAVLQGRYHFYEGHDIRDVVLPVRMLIRLGIKILFLSNAAGGINREFSPGDLMVIHDHINLMGVNPLRGENDQRLGPRFPDMSRVYDPALATLIETAISGMGLTPRSGVYLALSGPSYETPAEIRMLARLGADAVGMSTVPEAIVARHGGAKVAAVSCITNLAAGISGQPLSHAEVTATADRVKESFIALLKAVVPKM